jgi:hypothetical protein
MLHNSKLPTSLDYYLLNPLLDSITTWSHVLTNPTAFMVCFLLEHHRMARFTQLVGRHTC